MVASRIMNYLMLITGKSTKQIIIKLLCVTLQNNSNIRSVASWHLTGKLCPNFLVPIRMRFGQKLRSHPLAYIFSYKLTSSVLSNFIYFGQNSSSQVRHRLDFRYCIQKIWKIETSLASLKHSLWCLRFKQLINLYE